VILLIAWIWHLDWPHTTAFVCFAAAWMLHLGDLVATRD
jgi:hypothetical protein